MGAHWQVINLYTHFVQEGWLNRSSRVLDFGSCDVSCLGETRYLSNFLRAIAPEMQVTSDKLKSFDGAPISKMFKSLGMEYDCVDIDGRAETIQIDLNYQDLPSKMVGAYQFVCDNGTFEHILNQLNCFKTAHDACAPNGILFFHKPFIGHYNHGFYNYMPDLFVQLALANSWELLGIWSGIDVDPGFAPIDMKIAPNTSHAILFVVARKRSGAPFRLPYNFNGSDLMGRESEKY